MRRVTLPPRADWQAQVERLGFAFHSIDGATYWDESVAYAFTLEEIERDIEAPTEAIEQLCFAFIDKALGDEAILTRLAIPHAQWDFIRSSWQRGDRNLYGRLDLAYDGRGSAKLLEYNADTPTALFESAVVQWDWLEQAMALGTLPRGSDQFNSLHERLIAAFAGLRDPSPFRLHLSSVQNSNEDKGTVDYLMDCAKQAGLDARFSYVEEIGLLPTAASATAPTSRSRPCSNSTLGNGCSASAMPMHWQAHGASSSSRPGRRSSPTRACSPASGRWSLAIPTCCRPSSKAIRAARRSRPAACENRSIRARGPTSP